MGVHRISDRAEEALARIAASEGLRKGEFLSILIVSYAEGLGFEGFEGNLDRLPAPPADMPIVQFRNH